MEIRSYNNEMAFANLLFKRLFSNIVITRRKGDESKDIPVKCIIGNRSRIFKDLENHEKAANYSLPMIVIMRTGVQRNSERLSKLHNEVVNSPNSKTIIYDLYTPVPIDIEYSVTVISKYPGDNDMIMSNFIPFFNSDLFVTCVHPKFNNLTYSSQVIMGDSITEEHPDEFDETTDDIITTTFNFTFKTFIFAGSKKVDAKVYTDDDTGIVYDGFIPAVTRVRLDIHAVPRHDITMPQLSTVISNAIIVDPDTGKESVQELSTLVYVNGDPHAEYPFPKYWDDFYEKDLFSDDYKPCLRDILRWKITENGLQVNYEDEKTYGVKLNDSSEQAGK